MCAEDFVFEIFLYSHFVVDLAGDLAKPVICSGRSTWKRTVHFPHVG